MNEPHRKNDIYQKDKSVLPRRRKVPLQSPSSESSSKDKDPNVGLYGKRERKSSMDEDLSHTRRSSRPPQPPAPSSNRASSKSRRRHSRGMSFSNKVVLTLLLLVLVAYLALLGITVYKDRPGAEPVLAEGPPPDAETESAPLSALPMPWADPENLATTIEQWKGAQSALNRSVTPRERGDLDRAASILEEALEQMPDNVELQFALAGIYGDQKRREESAELYWRVLKTDPSHARARLGLAGALAGLGNHEAVLEISRWILEVDAFIEEPNHLTAQAHLALGQTEMAVPYLRRLVALNRENVVARNNLAVAYSRLGEYNQAITLFKEVLRADDSNSITYYNLAVCYAQQNNAALAVETLSDAADAFGTPFVSAWVQSRDFDPIRDSAEFKTLERRVNLEDEQNDALAAADEHS